MMQKIIDYFKQYIGVISIVLALCILLTYSLSYFKVNIDNKRAAEMYIGELKYSMTIEGSSTNTLTVSSGETIVDIDLTNQNEIKTYYKLLYLKNANISISYFNQTKNTSEEVTNYKAPSDSVESKSQNSLKLKIINSSSSNQTLTFKVSGGYSTNTLADVEVPNTYTEITSLETPSTNTYFCKTNDTLTQGLEYVDGQYTYGYKKEGEYSSSGLAWSNISNNGWGVQLTDKTSTDAVTSKLCTYINNKPVVSMSYMFSDSKTTTLDVSNFDTSNVTNMSNMFLSSEATTLDVSNFDTSNVTNMSNMFLDSKATTLDVSNFDTSKVTNMQWMFAWSEVSEIKGLNKFNTRNVTNMSYMFYNSPATTIDVSNFDTSKVTDMSYMFESSQATTLDVSNFNTSNVTNMDSMFSTSKATTLDLSNFDTSNITNMSSMFYYSQATTLDVSNFNTSKVTDMHRMFLGSKATALDVSSFDTSKVTNMSYMFNGSSNLKTIYVSNKFNTNNVTNSTNMFKDSTKLVGGAGTKYNSSYVDKTYAHIDGGTSNPGYFTDVVDKDVPAPNSFTTDSWKTIIKAVKNNNISKYNVGDTRTIDMGTYGTHTLRIANTSTPSECKTEGFSQSACGFVLEFADIITTHNMNPSGTYKGTKYDYGWNVDGWPASSMYTFVNNDIYNALPSELRSAIIDTTVVSEYGKSDTENFTSTDKLYLLAPKEIYTDWSRSWDSAKDLTRTLDYYTNIRVTTSSYSGAIKYKGTSANNWWLRAANYINTINFLYVDFDGNCYTNTARITYGVAPAFRIG